MSANRIEKTVAALTGMLLAALVVTLLLWYMGFMMGNFSLLLFIMSVVCGLYWVAEKRYFLPQRVAAAAAFDAQHQARLDELVKQGITQVDHPEAHAQAREKLLAQPWWLDWTAGLFPVILAVFLLRSFLFEPFKIPSGSMIPTLLIGDLILVNKFDYGLRLPILNKKIIALNDPKRGDVMVFHFPKDERVDYIKRVVGLPGDTISYQNKTLRINGVEASKTAVPDFFDNDTLRYAQQFQEKLGSVEHAILNHAERPGGFDAHAQAQLIDPFPYREHCTYNLEGFTCKVPAGHYFMMGDNRDNSLDSRYWGFVPDRLIVGRAFLVWMNFSDIKRIGFFH